MSQEQCSNFGWGDVLHPDDAEQTISAWKECVRSGSAWDIEHRYRGVDGQWHDILARGLPVRNEHGDIIYWAGINLDISRRKKTEQSLRHSEERHRVLVETMMQGVVHQDATGKIISMNPAAERILGKSCDDFLGNNSVTVEHDTIRENGETFPGMEHPTMVALRTGLPVCGVIMGVFNPRLNEFRWIDIDAVPVIGPGESHPSEVYSVFEDITESKQTEIALLRAHDELEERVRKRTADLEAAVETVQSEITERLEVMEELRRKEQMLLQQSRLAAMGEMINNIAHQWRQPLNALGLLIQKLSIYYDSDQFDRKFLEETTVNSMKLIQHMSQTINDFRDFFRSDKEMVTFHLDAVVRQAVAFVEQTFQDIEIKIDLDIEQRLMVKGYPNEFAQALLNILMNARDALAGNNTADARIILRTFKDGGSSVVTVTDNAGGIPNDVIDRVFDLYFTTKSNTGNGAEFRIEVAHGDS
jgi:signal transduction histidine kinase